VDCWAQLVLAYLLLSSSFVQACLMRFDHRRLSWSIPSLFSARMSGTGRWQLGWERIENACAVGTTQTAKVLAVALHLVARRDTPGCDHA
jgi:hypothetical protein